MKSLNKIKMELDDLKMSLGLEGVVTDSIVCLLARSLYENQIFSTNLTLESSFNRSKLLSSKITHASDRGYSVFRGRNQRVVFFGLKTVQAINVKKFDTLMSIGQLQLVFARDYNLESNLKNVEIECILSSGIENVNLSINRENKLLMPIVDIGISEDLKIIKGNGEELAWTNKITKITNIPFPYTVINSLEDIKVKQINIVGGVPIIYNVSQSKIFLTSDGELYVVTPSSATLLQSGIPVEDTKLIVRTTPGYGVEIINRGINSVNGLRIGDMIKISYLVYTTENIDFNSIKTIPLFDFGETLNYRVLATELRENNLEEIYLKATNEFLENFVIRSNNDLESLIKSFFSDFIQGFKLQKDFLDTNRYVVVELPATNLPIEMDLVLNVNGKKFNEDIKNLLVYNVETGTFDPAVNFSFLTSSYKRTFIVALVNLNLNFNISNSYDYGDFVVYDNKYYFSTQNNNIGNTPTLPSEWWELAADESSYPMKSEYQFVSKKTQGTWGSERLFVNLQKGVGIEPQNINFWEVLDTEYWKDLTAYPINTKVINKKYDANFQPIIKPDGTFEVAVYENTEPLPYYTRDEPTVPIYQEPGTETNPNINYWFIQDSINYYDNKKEYTVGDVVIWSYTQTDSEGNLIPSTYDKQSLVQTTVFNILSNGAEISKFVEKQKEFVNYVQRAYSINNMYFDFCDAKKYLEKDVPLKIKVVYNSLATSQSSLISSIYDIKENFKNKIGQKISVYDIMSEISQSEGVISVLPSSDFKGDTIQLINSNYFSFSLENDSIYFEKKI